MPDNFSLTGVRNVRGGAALIIGETDGFAIDFTYHTEVGKQMRVTTASVPVDSDPASSLTYTTPSVKNTIRASGLLTATNGTTDLPYEWDTSGNSLGILVEEARTNLALRGSDFTNASWTKSNMTTAQTATGPDGGANTATTLTSSAGNATALQAITSGSAARITSMYVKRRTGTGNIDMTQNNGTNWTTVTTTTSWTRVAMATVTSANPTVGIRIVTSTDAVDVAFFQHEVGSFVTSPISTAGATVTRAGDLITLAGASISSTAGSMVVAYSYDSTAKTTYDDGVVGAIGLCVYSGGGASNRMQLHTAQGDGTTALAFVESSAAQAILDPSGAVSANVTNKLAGAWAANDFVGVFNAGTAVTDSAGSVGAMSTFSIGSLAGGGQATNGYSNAHIRQVTYSKRRITNGELQLKTT